MVYKKPACDSIFNFKTTLSGRATTQGYSTKWDFTKNLKTTPSPNSYFQTENSFFKSIKKGAVLGKKIPTIVNKLI